MVLQDQTLWIMLTFWSYFWLHGMLSCVTSDSSPKYFTYTVLLLVPHMMLILNICYDHSILIRRYEHLQRCMQAASTHKSIWSRCGNWVWYWLPTRLTNKPRRVWTSATHKRRTQYCWASREHGPVNEELMRRLIPVSTYDGFDVLLYNLKVCHNKIVCL